AQEQARIDEVQPPLGAELAGDDDVARDVVGARGLRVAVHGDGQVGAGVVLAARGGEQAGNADEGRGDRLALEPLDLRAVLADRGAREVRAHRAGAAGEGRGVGARRLEVWAAALAV